MEHGFYLRRVIGECQQQVFITAGGHHVLYHRPYRHVVGPELLAHENHRAGESERQIMVLYGILEDLLQGACAAGCKDDTAKSYSQDGVLTNAVHE